MKKYTTYKNSNIDWIGEIPEHWHILPGLSFIYENKEKNIGLKRSVVLSLSYGNIRIRKEEELTGLVPESFETYQLVNVGDLIFRPTDLQNDKVSLRSAISEFDGIITSAYLNLRFKENANPKYFHYFFRSIDNNKVIYGLGSGLRQNISYLDFKRFPFIFPPLSEQVAIAEFLDEKTGKIDEVIRIKEREIELLKERRQILIQEVVTGKKVWNPATGTWTPPERTKDSGIDWIGEIPEDWEVRRLKHFVDIRNEKIDSRGFDGVYIGMENIESNTGKYVGEKLQVEGIANKFKKGDILFGKLRPYLAKVHKCKFNGICSTEFLIIKTENPSYFQKLMISKNFIDIVDASTYGAKMPRANANFILNLRIAIPREKQQRKVISYLENIESKISQLIALKKEEIEKLKEYKTVLIDAAVTGKVKVG